MQHFLKANDVLPVDELINIALQHKANAFDKKLPGKDRTIGLVFFNSSLRTRLSSQRAAQNIGANTWVLDVSKDAWKLEMETGVVMNSDKAEHIKEAISVMSQYCDILGVRAFPKLQNREEDYNEVLFKQILEYTTVPVVSLESATRHPLQSLADLITIKERFPSNKIVKAVLTWAPHPRVLPQSVPNSFAEWCQAVDWIDLTIAAPDGYALAEKFSGKGALLSTNQNQAFKEADIIYAKNWSSYAYYGQCPDVTEDWMITAEKMARTNNAYFMHCLPVRRNVVVADEVLDSDRSLVIRQAHNRMYSAQAVFGELLE